MRVGSRPRLWRIGVLLLATGVASGCVSVRPVEPGADFELGPNEGLLVVDIDTELEIGMLRFGGMKAAEDLPAGEHFYLLAVTAGTYRWNQIELPSASGVSVGFVFFRDDTLRFRIRPGRINYTGQLVFWGDRGERHVAVGGGPINRSALALRRLRERYPGLVERYPPVFAASYRDDFLERFARGFRPATSDAGGEAAE